MTRSTTGYNRGDVVLVPFPFSDLTATKKRPAVVISSRNYNRASMDVVIMAITSNVSTPIGIGESLIQDWETAGLLVPSAVKAAISTLEQSLVLRTLGALTKRDMLSLDKSLRQLLELS